MKNNIKKAPVKFREDLLHFLAFYADFFLCPKSVIITILTNNKITGDKASKQLFPKQMATQLPLLNYRNWTHKKVFKLKHLFELETKQHRT